MNSETTKPIAVALVVDDEPQIRRLLRVTLEANGYRVFDAATRQDGVAQAAQRRPDLVLLDLVCRFRRREVLKRLREWSKFPSSSRASATAKTTRSAALDAGADDYVTKPFNSAELLGSLRAALRHATLARTPSFAPSDLEVDLAARRSQIMVRKQAHPIRVFPLRLLVTHAGKVLDTSAIVTKSGGRRRWNRRTISASTSRTCGKKIEATSGGTDLIRTEPGIGYRLPGFEADEKPGRRPP